ncbi:FtsQ-type POTRA domain-containing protein [Anabaena sp. FACHB-1237]|uniref:cell division protein FtsQ/DivIB n=1 Tax=Anabaena sp. FACHB-1237 TaxID=2692769 RepID=UPI001681B605|nr:FtsQ-type POTRA domain-containing protein [Anabaena sp. FACHB-1237]MBD2136147.1 FtsQ-type POTRA domain-containing protein [Anabaena sp. FACHB-1237]
MAGILSVSRKSLRQRRKKLQRQRQIKIMQNIWQTLAVTGLASGLFWIALQPIWVLKNAEQIVVKSGDKILTGKDVNDLIALSYPQSLWRIKPGKIAESLKKKPTISEASVTRRLFPPGLIIDIKEKLPVAIAELPLYKKPQPCQTDKKSASKPCAISSNNSQQNNLNLLDEQGELIPLKIYQSLNPNLELPQLRVLGDPREYKPFWSQIYQAIADSSLQVKEIDYRDPTNIIFTTELGKFHLGSPSYKLPEQIKLMAKMKGLADQLNPGNIDYIDLQNPNSPMLVEKNLKKTSTNTNEKLEKSHVP